MSPSLRPAFSALEPAVKVITWFSVPTTNPKSGAAPGFHITVRFESQRAANAASTTAAIALPQRVTFVLVKLRNLVAFTNAGARKAFRATGHRRHRTDANLLKDASP